jgi:8-oxo-dGTP pyrophosphatase MutT (NUDIX family)
MTSFWRCAREAKVGKQGHPVLKAKVMERAETPTCWRSAGLLAYRRSNGRVLWLLIDSRLSKAASAWEFPKGLIEPGEDRLAAALRECAEETGVRVAPEAVHPTFHERVEWTMRHKGRLIHRVVDYFLAEAFQEATRGDWEVREVRWVETREALKPPI